VIKGFQCRQQRGEGLPPSNPTPHGQGSVDLTSASSLMEAFDRGLNRKLKAAVHKNSQTGFWLLFLQQARCCCAWACSEKKRGVSQKTVNLSKNHQWHFHSHTEFLVSIFVLGLRCVGVPFQPNALPMCCHGLRLPAAMTSMQLASSLKRAHSERHAGNFMQ